MEHEQTASSSIQHPGDTPHPADFGNQVLHAAPDPVYVLSADTGALSYTNYRAGEVLGWSPKMSGAMMLLAHRVHPEDQALYAAHAAACKSLQDRASHRVALRLQTADGSYRRFHLCDAPLSRHPDGRPKEIVGVLRAIDDQELTEAVTALRESEEKYRSLFNSMDVGYCIIELLYDPAGQPSDWRYLEVNPAFEKNNGLTNATGKTILELVPDIEPKWLEIYGRVAATGEAIRFEERSDALQRWFNLYAFRVGRPDQARVAVLFNDVTKRKQDEAWERETQAHYRAALEVQVAQHTVALKDSNELLSAVAEASPDIIYVMDLRDRQTTYANRSLGLMLGYTQEQLDALREPLFDLMYEPDLIRMLEHIRNMADAADGEVREIQYRLKAADGSLHWFVDRNAVFSRSADGIPREKIGITQNITDKKRSETELYKNLRILRQAEDIAGAGSWEWDSVLQHFRWSEGEYRLFGLETGTPVQPEIYLERATAPYKAAAQRLVRAIRQGTKPFEETLSILAFDGTERMLKVKCVSFDDVFGRPSKRLGVDMDTTSEIALRRDLEERLRFIETLSNALPDRIAVLDRAHRFIAWNRRCEEAYGLRQAEVVGRKLGDVFPQLNLKTIEPALAAALRGEPHLYEAQQAVMIPGFVDIALIPIWTGASRESVPSSVLVILHDVTERVHAAAAQKAQHQALENAYGELTTFTKIASHDLKEPLRKIYTFIEMLLQHEASKLSNNGRATFRRIQMAVQRMGLLTDDMATFSEISAWRGALAPLPLDTVLQNALLPLQAALLQSRAVLTAEPLPVVNGSQALLEQLFQQVLGNAIKFQPKESGHVPQVRLRWEEVPGSALQHPDAQPETAYHRIAIEDNGVGFDPAYSERIFGMFQRLHAEGEYKGSGMGLAIARKVAELHGGFITASGEPGRGSVFTLYLPAGDVPAASGYTTTIS